ncbi:MAG: signal peptidase I [Lysobacteraceae bacterium]|nr:MAG: signal peptidase I [Xanthomonadaceae bacterium]
MPRDAKPKPSLLRRIRQSSPFQFAVIVILILASRSAVADWNYVPTGSMKPTILEGDWIWVDRLAYDLKVPFTTIHIAQWADPQRGDVVVAYSPEDGERIVKRVLAIGGDTIVSNGQTLTVNGEPSRHGQLASQFSEYVSERDLARHQLAEELAFGRRYPVMFGPPAAPLPKFKVTLQDGEYFLMGDHRNNSHDSRFFGPVPRDLILGRATRVIASVDSDQLGLRWNRFGSEMP